MPEKRSVSRGFFGRGGRAVCAVLGLALAAVGPAHAQPKPPAAPARAATAQAPGLDDVEPVRAQVALEIPGPHRIGVCKEKGCTHSSTVGLSIVHRQMSFRTNV